MYKYICCAKPFIDQEPEFRTLLGVKEDNEAKRRNRKKIFIVDDDEGKLNAIKECMREIFLDAAIFTYTCLRDIYHVIFHIRGEGILAHKRDCLLVCDHHALRQTHSENCLECRGHFIDYNKKAYTGEPAQAFF